LITEIKNPIAEIKYTDETSAVIIGCI